MRRIEAVIERLRESARTRAVGSLGLCFLLLLAGPSRLAAQESASRLVPASADHGCPATSETAALTRSFQVYRLLSPESRDHEPWITSPDALSVGTTAPDSWTQSCATQRLVSADSSESERHIASSDLTMDDTPRFDQAETEVPRWAFLERHRLLLTALIPIGGLVAVTANSLIGYDTEHGFRIRHEGWFGPNTANGGADKASHLVDYFIVASVFEDAYRILGYSEKAAILGGFATALVAGLGNEVSDGFTRHSFSWEDLAMDVAGAATASVLSATHTRDLLGMRTSHIPGSTYTHDVYSADFKISGLARRLGVNLGPLRWLLLSVTYGTKGYRVSPPIEHQRLVGFEVGLNLQQILNDLGVRRNTWWGYSLHLFGDYIRFPFTAVGMRLNLNSGKWHGPNSGNYD
jgi:uncharacterized protein YfiM (DUF2279 family)